jgi:Ser/Thr protein kinase RdoA (MazF antagonist)
MIPFFVLLTMPLMQDFAAQKGMDLQEIQEGYSETPIYLMSHQGKPRYVVKVYEPDSAVLKDDLKGHKSALALHLNHLRVPRILNEERIENHVVVTQEYVPGTSLWKINDPEVFRKLGQGLREFHDKSTWKCGPPSNELLGHLNWVIEQGLNRAEMLGMKPDEMKKKIGSLGENPVPWSLLHHDPQLGNYLYDAGTGRIAMIDLGDGAQFINPYGKGLGTPLYDYVKVVDHITNHKREFLKAFEEGYGPIGDEQSKRYFSMVNALAGLDWHLKTKGQAPDRLIKRLHDLFND